MLRLLSVTAALRILGAVMQLALTFAITRTMGAAESGIFFFGYSIVIILSTLARLGSELSGMRSVAAARADRSVQLMSAAVSARIAVTLVVAVGLALGQALIGGPLAARLFGSPDASVSLLLLAAALPAMALLGLVVELLKAADRASLGIALQNIAVPALTEMALLCGVYFGRTGALIASAAFLAAAWISVIVAMMVWRVWVRAWVAETGGEGAVGPSSRRGEIFGVLRDAPALLVVSSTSIIMQWTGAVILGFLAQPDEVAGYSVAIRLSLAVSIIHSAASSVIAPKLATAFAAGKLERLRTLTHQTSIIIFSSTLPILLLLFLFAPFWLSLFGEGFASFGSTLRILVCAQVIAALVGHSGTLLVMCGEYASARLTSIVAAVTLAALMVILVPGLGSDGAALAMSGGVIAGHLAAMVLAHGRLGFWSMPTSRADFTAIPWGER